MELTRRAGVAALLLVVVACGDDANTERVRQERIGTSPTTVGPVMAAATPASPTGEAGADASAAAGSAAGATGSGGDPVMSQRSRGWTPEADPEVSDRLASVAVGVEVVATTTSAVDLAVRPGDDALYVVEHSGRVVRIADGSTTEVHDVRDRLIGHRDEQGLTGLEFSADGGHAWTHETSPDGETTIREFAVADDGSFDHSAERVVLGVGGPPGLHHNAGDLLRAPDGTLLVALGDGDAAGTDESGVRRAEPDPHRVAHDPAALRGSILRIRPTPGADEPYEIPDDNPFADGPLVRGDGSVLVGRPEVWAWGLRNPWKLALDDATGTLWVADVGGDLAEEINVVVATDGGLAGATADFGWSGLEGTNRQNDDVDPLLDRPIDPALAYPHEGLRCAISGGAVYRGDEIPDLRGGYVFADFCEGSLWVYDAFTRTARNLRGADGIGGLPGLSGVRTGPDGELYALSWFGEVYRLIPG